MTSDDIEFVKCVCQHVTGIRLSPNGTSYPDRIELPLSDCALSEGSHEFVAGVRLLVTGTCELPSPLCLDLEMIRIGDDAVKCRNDRYEMCYESSNISAMYWYQRKTPPMCTSKGIISTMAFIYKLTNRHKPRKTSDTTDLIFTFVYNVVHTVGGYTNTLTHGNIPKRFSVSKLYRFGMANRPEYMLSPLVLRFVGFDGTPKDITGCITSSMKVPNAVEYTYITSGNVGEDYTLTFGADYALYNDYLTHRFESVVYLHLRIDQPLATDTEGTSVDECYLYMTMDEGRCGGHLIRYMISEDGMTLADYRPNK
jgi:hypothetical protein